MCVALLIGIPAFVFLVLVIVAQFAPDPHGYAEINFDSFKKFYEINPKRWELHKDFVRCVVKDDVYGGIFNEYECFEFSFADYQKYKKWLKNKQASDLKMKHMESTANMIEAVKQDIEKFEKMSDAEINKAKSIIEILCEV